MEIRELGKDEIGKLVDFYADIALSEALKDERRKMFENDIRSAWETNHMLVAMDDDGIVGFLWAFISVNKFDKKVDRVKMLLISPEKFGEGIGGALVEAERDYAKAEGVDLLDIDTI
jgi:GNAT superfamily N-acetyltransferase